MLAIYVLLGLLVWSAGAWVINEYSQNVKRRLVQKSKQSRPHSARSRLSRLARDKRHSKVAVRRFGQPDRSYVFRAPSGEKIYLN